MNSIDTVHAMSRANALEAETVTVYRMDDGPQAGMCVIEITDVHRIVIGRTLTDAQDIADHVLDRSPLQRCSAWTTIPMHGGKRLSAMVTLDVTSNPGTLGLIAQQHAGTTATA